MGKEADNSPAAIEAAFALFIGGDKGALAALPLDIQHAAGDRAAQLNMAGGASPDPVISRLSANVDEIAEMGEMAQMITAMLEHPTIKEAVQRHTVKGDLALPSAAPGSPTSPQKGIT